MMKQLLVITWPAGHYSQEKFCRREHWWADTWSKYWLRSLYRC